MKIRDVELEEFVDLFNAQQAAADYALNWSVEIMGRTFSCRYDRSFDSRGSVVTRRVECTDWTAHTEMLDGRYADEHVYRVIFSGDDQRFVNDLIAFKMTN